jgi:MoxR-like ATPase
VAAMDGRFSVAIDDIKKIAAPVLRHRLSTHFQAPAERMSTEDVIVRLVSVMIELEVSKFA